MNNEVIEITKKELYLSMKDAYLFGLGEFILNATDEEFDEEMKEFDNWFYNIWG